MSGERILQGLREAVEYAESAPSDAEVEAMAERLWEAWRKTHTLEEAHRYVDWPHLCSTSANGSLPDIRHDAARLVGRFRAMARVALERLKAEVG